MNKKAFTMIELIFVIVMAVILVAIAVPKSNRNPIREAADQVMAHIRYTQNLAMQDDKFDPNDNEWYKGYWQIYFTKSANFTNNEQTYNVFSDKNKDSNPNLNELAINPEDHTKLMSAGFAGILNFSDSKASKNLNLTKKYRIKDVELTRGCSGSGSPKRLAFDNIGRPMKGSMVSATSAYSHLMTDICNITLIEKRGKRITLLVYPESGFVCIAKIDPVTKRPVDPQECEMVD